MTKEEFETKIVPEIQRLADVYDVRQIDKERWEATARVTENLLSETFEDLKEVDVSLALAQIHYFTERIVDKIRQ
ncbi:MAG TPA: hypothetical protein VLH19_02700 [Patescibacteria group bacterium]|nr:hypothetical protein [Patescibacteria group bacterium]